MYDNLLRPERRPHFFERGDIKYVILDLLKDKPSHGYEIIRDLEERFHGLYSPSPGTVYPTLQLLEDLGYVTSTESEGKKVFTITESGRSFLVEKGEIVRKIRGYSKDWEGVGDRDDFKKTHQELRDIYRLLSRGGRQLDPDKFASIRKIISKAYQDIKTEMES